MGPMPGITRIGSGSRKAWTSSGRTTVRPSGFLKSEAILATSLLGPMPTVQVRPSRATISRFTPSARSAAASKLPSDERSRYASSTLASSKASAPWARNAMSRAETSR